MRTRRILTPAVPSDGFAPAFFGANADALLQVCDEDLTVADRPPVVLAAGENGVDGCLDEFVVAGDVDADLGDQVGDDALAAIERLIGLPATVAATAPWFRSGS